MSDSVDGEFMFVDGPRGGRTSGVRDGEDLGEGGVAVNARLDRGLCIERSDDGSETVEVVRCDEVRFIQ